MLELFGLGLSDNEKMQTYKIKVSLLKYTN